MRSEIPLFGGEADRDAFLGSVLDNLADGVLVVDADGKVCAANPAASRLMGYEGSELVGSEVTRVFPADWRTLAAHGTAEVSLRSRGGVPVAVEVGFGSMERDGVSHHVCTLRDATERQILEERVRHAQRIETFGAIAQVIAHEFNNILTVVMSEAGLARGELGEAHPVAEGLQSIVAQGERAARLARQILTFTRYSAGPPRETRVNAVVADMGGLLGRLLGRPFQVDTQLSEIPTIHADPALVEQVLVHLCLAARAAMPMGGRIRISTRRVLITGRRPHGRPLPAGPYVELSVSDTGHGTEPTTLAAILDLVERQGGAIEAESEPGRGTTVVVLFRATEAEPVDPPREVPGAPEEEPVLLLAEDDHTVRRLMADVLRRHGYTVVDANDGIEARALFDAEPERFGAAVLDWSLPRLGGDDLYRAIQERRPGLPVLWVSGLTMGVACDGRSDFLAKPFTGEELGDRVRALLERHVPTH